MKRLTEEKLITEFFGSNVFNDSVMREYLEEGDYLKLKNVIENNQVLDKELAEIVAQSMMKWAIKNGATHYTHWFQPLNGNTAEKHDSFISIDKNGKTIMEFTGKNLSKGETDASSFPSGGIRATFEARGYTVWDCSSPAFIKKSKGGASILYIPTAFCSYNGDALDKKTPLLRSMEALSHESVRLLKLMGDSQVKKVYANVGGEQEYFLIEKKHFDNRLDLRYTGRTLFGAPAPKAQEGQDQYYGTIRERVADFMADLNEELWKLGITAKTQHNEVAPCQHELAPIYCTANIATDQNQLIMETMKKVALEHNFTCLLHEKPFASVNGSGKHNNWSLITSTGKNLLQSGKNPATSLEFLMFFVAVISAVDEYADLVRMSASNSGNEYRLGMGEAPPAIISVFVGDELYSILNHIAEGSMGDEITKQRFKTGINYLAEFSKDNSDRNRTSPFAYTGNKFEFRMVGASATLANPNTTINTIVAEMLSRFSDELEAKGNFTNKDIIELYAKYWNKHKRIIFNGNNYAKEWVDEAKARGLMNIESSVDAYNTLVKDKNVKLFEKHRVMSMKELESRKEIYLENYHITFKIEAKTMLEMAKKEILPAVLKYMGKLAKYHVKAEGISKSFVFKDKYAILEELCEKIIHNTNLLERAVNEVESIKGNTKKAEFARANLLPLMKDLRKSADDVEVEMPKDTWPFPNYADILFYI